MSKIHFDTIFMPTTKNKRTLRIYLPEGYDDHGSTYPVLYMHDAQNLFDDATSYAGLSWGIKDTLDDLIKNNKIPKLIVVGIDNAPSRMDEYAPWQSSQCVDELFKSTWRGQGDLYVDVIVNDLKPYIDAHYQTKSDYHSTMIAGSSMGALISSYAAFKYPNVFGVVGVFSLASWFNEDRYLSYLKQASLRSDQLYFIAVGTNESLENNSQAFPNIYLNHSRHLRDALKAKGVQSIFYQETDDEHHEKQWKKAFKPFILFAFGQHKNQ